VDVFSHPAIALFSVFWNRPQHCPTNQPEVSHFEFWSHWQTDRARADVFGHGSWHTPEFLEIAVFVQPASIPKSMANAGVDEGGFDVSCVELGLTKEQWIAQIDVREKRASASGFR